MPSPDTDTRTPTRTPKGYPPETVLHIEEVAEWLDVSVRTIERLPIKRIPVGFNVEWDEKSGYIEIGTGKKDKAVRRVPLIREPVIPECDYQVFADRIRVASGGQMTPYDFRRTYANWLEAAGVPRTRRMIYMGHGAVDITGRYEWHEVKAFLAEDAEKVKLWLDGEIKKAEAEKKAKAKGGLRVLK